MAFLVTIEGGEGSGKSTLLRSIEDLFRRNNLELHTTREPGGTGVGEEIRQVLLKAGRSMSALTELLLYEAARHEHVEKVIRPKLQSGSHVICDRYADSSLAYQGIARGLDLNMVKDLNKLATGNLNPDATIWLKIPPEQGVKRSIQSGGKNRFEEEKMSFHERVFEGFLKLSKENKNFVVLDATQKPEQVFQELLSHSKWKELFGDLK